MITNWDSTAANLAAAAYLARSADATPAPASSSPSRAQARPLLPGKVPARTLATARRAPATAKKTRSGRSSPAGYAAPKASSRSTTKASSKSSASGPLAFLHDPKLSIEEKLVMLLGYLNGKWEKEMNQKLQAFDAAGGGEKKAESASSSKKKSGGILGSLGSIGDLVGSLVAPASAALKIPLVRDVLKQAGGPVLAAGATALGFPQFAPLLLKYGPELVGAASSLVSSLDGGGAGGSASSASGGGSAGSSGGDSKALSDTDRQMLTLQIQRIQEKQREMFGLVSNVLKANHDSRLSVISNIR